MLKTKQDNSDLDAKLELRRVCLKAWHGSTSPIRVLDCCAGENILWTKLREEFSTRYVGLDKAQRGHGNIKIDSVRWLRSAKLAVYDVIDVDTYGEPWAHWMEILGRLTKDTTVFLTCGAFGPQGRSAISMRRKALAGIPGHWQLPMSDAVANLLTARCLGALYSYRLGCTGAYEAQSRSSGTRYFAVRLTPAKQ